MFVSCCAQLITYLGMSKLQEPSQYLFIYLFLLSLYNVEKTLYNIIHDIQYKGKWRNILKWCMRDKTNGSPFVKLVYDRTIQSVLDRQCTGVFRNSALGVYLVFRWKWEQRWHFHSGNAWEFFPINAPGVLRRMGAATEIPGNIQRTTKCVIYVWTQN